MFIVLDEQSIMIHEEVIKTHQFYGYSITERFTSQGSECVIMASESGRVNAMITNGIPYYTESS